MIIKENMELGNILFGNSRGAVPIERGAGYEREIEWLFDAIWHEDEMSRGGAFENATFSIFPYYWGECDCGYDDIDFSEIKHNPECYQTAYRALRQKYDGRKWDDPDHKAAVKGLCNTFKLSYPEGCAVHCTCDYLERLLKAMDESGYPDGCLETCVLRKPNFHYKPTDVRIEWYKYPLRDAYFNKEVSFEEFREIINLCIKSLDDNNS